MTIRILWAHKHELAWLVRLVGRRGIRNGIGDRVAIMEGKTEGGFHFLCEWDCREERWLSTGWERYRIHPDDKEQLLRDYRGNGCVSGMRGARP